MDENKQRLAVDGQTKCKIVVDLIMNKTIPYLITDEAKPGYKLFIEFEDGISGEVDLSGKVGKGVFEYWKDELHFLKVYIP